MLELKLNTEIDNPVDNIKNDKVKFLIQLDNRKYHQKPSGTEIGNIKIRTQSSEAKVITIRQFAKILEQGQTYSPGVLKDGLGARYWTQQQVFPVDIDNDNKNFPILSIKDALNICAKEDIKPDLYYESFSSTKEKQKFRLIFIMDKPVYAEQKRIFVTETLLSLFPQADNACKNADRIFFGTNKKVTIL